MTKKRNRGALARRAEKLMAKLPESDGLRPMGGPVQQHVVTGPGFMGMCPVLYTENYNIVVFLPYDLYLTIRDIVRATGSGGMKPMIRVATQGENQQLVTKAFHEW